LLKYHVLYMNNKGCYEERIYKWEIFLCYFYVPMKRVYILLTVLTVFSLSSVCQGKLPSSFMVVSWNVENLYDTLNDPQTQDEDYTPKSKLGWTTGRYNKKLLDIATVLSLIDHGKLPDVVGLCEIENRSVLRDLVQQSPIKAASYKIVHEESDDPRGIDVALLYRSDHFKVMNSFRIPVHYPGEKNSRSRGILYIRGIALGKDTLHIFVNHWKSRNGDETETEVKRDFDASMLRLRIDSLLLRDRNSKILCLGDMNDESTNNSISNVLKASCETTFPFKSDLVDLMCSQKQLGIGSYSYKGRWLMLDHIILSKSLLNRKTNLYASPLDAKVFNNALLLKENPKANEKVPYKTYGGDKYMGGVSDHLPVYVNFRVEKFKSK
jgi:predicted extracellular nuclease